MYYFTSFIKNQNFRSNRVFLRSISLWRTLKINWEEILQFILVMRPERLGKDFIVKERRSITKLAIFDLLVYRISNTQIEKQYNDPLYTLTQI